MFYLEIKEDKPRYTREQILDKLVLFDTPKVRKPRKTNKVKEVVKIEYNIYL